MLEFSARVSTWGFYICSMNRKRIPSAPHGLNLNTKTGFYEITEHRITYELTYSQMNDMKSYLSGLGRRPSIIEWYNSLEPYEKKNVKRIGVAAEPDDFRPDPEWPE